MKVPPIIEYFYMNEWKPLISLFILVSTLHYMFGLTTTHYVSLVLNFWVSLRCFDPSCGGLCRGISSSDLHAPVCGGLEMVVEIVLCLWFCRHIHLFVLC